LLQHYDVKREVRHQVVLNNCGDFPKVVRLDLNLEKAHAQIEENVEHVHKVEYVTQHRHYVVVLVVFEHHTNRDVEGVHKQLHKENQIPEDVHVTVLVQQLRSQVPKLRVYQILLRSVICMDKY
jgi:hypothetical protein